MGDLEALTLSELYDLLDDVQAKISKEAKLGASFSSKERRAGYRDIAEAVWAELRRRVDKTAQVPRPDASGLPCPACGARLRWATPFRQWRCTGFEIHGFDVSSETPPGVEEEV